MPSIGYVWIMRVFLFMALLLPLFYSFLDRRGGYATLLVITALIVLQQILVPVVLGIDNKILCFLLDETLLYALGYSSIAILGLKIRQLSSGELSAILVMAVVGLFAFVYYNNFEFDPQQFKYPPQGQYILYGIIVSALLWLLRPALSQFVELRLFKYLSENSMWIYLWHIIPVYLIQPLSAIHNMWFARFLIVLISALLLNAIYHKAINFLPERITKLLQ